MVDADAIAESVVSIDDENAADKKANSNSTSTSDHRSGVDKPSANKVQSTVFAYTDNATSEKRADVMVLAAEKVNAAA